MKPIFFLLVPAFLVSCTTAKLTVPNEFVSQATAYPVKGMNGWQVGQQLKFGQMTTSKVKRGWDFTASVQYSKFRLSPEEYLAKVLDITTFKNTNYQRNRFQYTIGGGSLEAEVYATEKFTEGQLVYKSNNPYIGNASKTNRYEYAFTAAIVPLTGMNAEPWSVVLINKYDLKNDTARKLFDRRYVEEEGYATNGKENIAIRPLRVESVTTAKEAQQKVWGGKLLAGYEIQWEGKPVAMIDILDNSIWLKNEMNPFQRLIVSAVSSAILLKRMQDVENDKGSFDQ
jgi:hypothetical protein